MEVKEMNQFWYNSRIKDTLYFSADGGGGPTREFIERIIRVQNVDGMPKYIFKFYQFYPVFHEFS